MYKMLIVDDDMNTIDGLSNCLNWSEMGITEINYALNGVQALVIMESFPANIVLADIAMPQIDGMELARQLSERYPDVRIIFITAFWEKEYVKSAFQNGVVDYILKPVKIDELKHAIDNVLKRLNESQTREQYILTLEKHNEKELPAEPVNLRPAALNSSDYLNQIKKLIDDNFMEDITIENMAETLYLSPQYICRVFKKEMGITINQYRTQCRMMRAAALIRNTDLQILYICNEVGYSDIKYFNKLFKEQFGMLPHKYRKLLRSG